MDLDIVADLGGGVAVTVAGVMALAADDRS